MSLSRLITVERFIAASSRKRYEPAPAACQLRPSGPWIVLSGGAGEERGDDVGGVSVE